MAGSLIKVIPKTSFDFSWVDVGQTSATIPIGVPLDAADFPNIGIVIRVHAATIDVGNFVQVNIYEDGFVDGSSAAFPGAYGNGISLAQGEAAPGVRFAYYHIIGRYASIGIRAENGAVSDGMTVIISVDAYLRNGNETPADVLCNPMRYSPVNVQSGGPSGGFVGGLPPPPARAKVFGRLPPGGLDTLIGQGQQQQLERPGLANGVLLPQLTASGGASSSIPVTRRPGGSAPEYPPSVPTTDSGGRVG